MKLYKTHLCLRHRIMNIPETATLPKNELASTYVFLGIHPLAFSPEAHIILNVLFIIPLFLL